MKRQIDNTNTLRNTQNRNRYWNILKALLKGPFGKELFGAPPISGAKGTGILRPFFAGGQSI